jgi:AcrR family transcriptional regulator
MHSKRSVVPNRLGLRSRDAVLDAAERLIAEHGYGSTTIAMLVAESGLPRSSIYHYFGSKEGALLAAMERGAQRFLDALPPVDQRMGTAREHLAAFVDIVAATLERQPDFLRLLIALAIQPRATRDPEIEHVIARTREQALAGLRTQLGIAFEIDPDGEPAAEMARFALAAFDGAFVAFQIQPQLTIGRRLGHLPAAIVGIKEQLDQADRTS